MKYGIHIDRERCKGCGLCVYVCGRSVIAMANRMNARGDHYAEVKDLPACVGCLNCAEICPDAAIEIVCEED